MVLAIISQHFVSATPQFGGRGFGGQGFGGRGFGGNILKKNYFKGTSISVG